MSFEYEKSVESIAALAATHAGDVDRGLFPSETLAALRAPGCSGW